jgi:hypothetical protein
VLVSCVPFPGVPKLVNIFWKLTRGRRRGRDFVSKCTLALGPTDLERPVAVNGNEVFLMSNYYTIKFKK